MFFEIFIEWRVLIKRPTGKTAATLKEVEVLMIPPDGVKQKLD